MTQSKNTELDHSVLDKLKSSETYAKEFRALAAVLMQKEKEWLAIELADRITREEIDRDIKEAYRPQIEVAKKSKDRMFYHLLDHAQKERSEWAAIVQELRQEVRENGPSALGAKGGKSKFIAERTLAIELALKFFDTRTQKPSRAETVRAILPHVKKAAKDRGAALAETKAFDTVDGWLKQHLAPTWFKERPTRSA